MPFLDHPRRSPSPTGRLAALVACCTLVLAGCGAEDGEPSGSEPGVGPTSAGVSPTESAALSPSASVSTAAPASPLPSPATLTDRLLKTEQVPGLNASWHWQDGETGAAGTDPFGLCAKVDLASIGASEVVERTYFPPVDSDDNAAEQIAEFPDTSTAARAAAVLNSWQKTCKTRVKGTNVKVRQAMPIFTETASSHASWYLVSYEEGIDEGRFHAFGIVTSGTRIAVLSIDNGGQDYNYPVGKEPMVAMVRAAAARLG